MEPGPAGFYGNAPKLLLKVRRVSSECNNNLTKTSNKQRGRKMLRITPEWIRQVFRAWDLLYFIFTMVQKSSL